MIAKNGDIKTIQINAVVVRKKGNIIGGLAVLRDITDIKQTEKNLQLQKDLIERILSTIPNAVLLLDKNLQVIMANKTFYDLFKLKNLKIEGKAVATIIKNPDLDNAILQVLDGKEKKASIEFRYTIESSDKVLIINVFAMEESNVLLVISDVTEEHETQQRLYLTDRLASVGEMASGVAHELNNPLTSIIGISEILLNENVPDDMKADLTAINAEAQRCGAIVKNLLTFARKHVPKREPVQITKIVEDVLQLRSYEHKAQNIITKYNFAPDLPKVLADYFQIQQVFLNIILNAETAMITARGSGNLMITGENVNGNVVISFSDDGPGIPKEIMGNIFNPFFTTKEVGKGTGLGLSICYGIITSHEGTIYAKSPPGSGATFVVELPALEPEKE
jgi:PAS domain S-box-containing protein